LFEARVAKAGADVADITPNLALANRQYQGAEIRAGPARRGEARDHDFLTLRGLDFEPVRRACAGKIFALPALGHNALKTLRLCLLEVFHAVLATVFAVGEERVPWQ